MSRKEKLAALAVSAGPTPEGQLAALRYLELCDDWRDAQAVESTMWWERPECGKGYTWLTPGCEAFTLLEKGRPSVFSMSADCVSATIDKGLSITH